MGSRSTPATASAARSPQATLRRGLDFLQSVQGALDVLEPALGQVGVERGGVEALVSEQGLDRLEPGAALDQVGREGVTERARRDALVDPRLPARGAEGALDAGGRDRASGVLALDQVLLRP